MAAGDRMGSHYLAGVGYEEALWDGCRGQDGVALLLRGLAMRTGVMAVWDKMGLHYLAGVGYEEDLCDGCWGRDEVALPCGGWL